MKKSICAVMCHADDIELYAGGTVAKYLAQGYRMLYGLLSNCPSGWTVDEERGGHHEPSAEIMPRRLAEAKAAAAVFGAEFWFGNLLGNCYTLKDGESYITPSYRGADAPPDDCPEGELLLVAAKPGMWPDLPIIDELADVLVEWQPELVLGQGIQNGNPDHFAAALIVARAWKKAAERCDIGPYWMPVSPPAPQRFQFPTLPADRLVDVTGHEELPLKALACHRTQGGHLDGMQGYMHRKWKHWGGQMGVPSAEGFMLVYER